MRILIFDEKTNALEDKANATEEQLEAFLEKYKDYEIISVKAGYQKGVKLSDSKITEDEKIDNMTFVVKK